MKYFVSLQTVDGDSYCADAQDELDGLPFAAETPIEMFRKVLDWCQERNVMPEEIRITSEGRAEDDA